MDLARYYVAWDRLMRHWEAVIGDAWLPVNYEELVADQKGVSRRIVAHCGLDWEDRCLDFHNSSVAVTTASAVQVRQPLYADSVGKWRAYARELEPLARYLESKVTTTSKLELLAPVALNIVCFRYLGDDANRLNADIVADLHESGIVAPSTTMIGDRLAIRAAIVNHRTSELDMDALIEATVAFGDVRRKSCAA